MLEKMANANGCIAYLSYKRKAHVYQAKLADEGGILMLEVEAARTVAGEPPARALRRSLTSRGFGTVARSRPAGLMRTLAHVPRVWDGRSLISLGLEPVARSRPAGLGRSLFHVPRALDRVCQILDGQLVAQHTPLLR